MSEHEADSIQVENWCAGYRYVDIRRLSDSEITVIRDAARRRGRNLVWLAPAPIAVLLLLLLGFERLPMVVWSVCWMYALLLGLPVWLLSVHDTWRAWVRLNRDARGGEGWNFELPLVLDEAGAELPPLSVLPASLHAFVPGTLMLSESPMAISEVAKGPSYSMRVPVQATTDAENAQAVADFTRRTLNDSEQGEIEIAIRRLRWPGVWLLFSPLWLVWAIVSFRAGVSSGTFLGVVMAALCVMAIARYFRGFALTMKMRRDLRTGWAITAPPKDSRAQQGPFIEEFLPHSKLMWTVNGSPAAWRDLKRAPLMLRR